MDAGTVKKLLAKGKSIIKTCVPKRRVELMKQTVVMADSGEGYVKFNLEFPQR